MSVNRDSAVKTRFFSLRWTIIIFLSLILLLVNSTLAYLNFRQSTLQYEAELQNVSTIQTRQIKALLENGFTTLSQISTFIPLMGQSNSSDSIEKRFSHMLEQSGTLLDIEWGIQSLQFFSKDGKILLSWPDIQGSGSETPPGIDFNTTQISEELICSPNCLQFVSSPMLKNGETIGYLLISRSIAEPVITFNKLTKSDVVILSSSVDKNSKDSSSLRQLDRWDKYISVMTHPDKIYPIIKQLENSVSLQGTGYLPNKLKTNDEWYNLNRVDLGDDIDVYIINNITENKKQITDAALSSLLIGLLGLILSEAMLLFLLRGPVSRLTNLATNLPLLVEGEYQLLRDKLQQDRKPGRRIIDEIDITLNATTELTDRLESLQISRQQAEISLTWLADHDTLTDLINRRRFQFDFENILNQAKRYQHRGALLFMDLDAFKEINDLSGHMAGDSLLRQVADNMHQLVRTTDLIARLGGDEFAIVVPEATESQAVELAAKICKAVSLISVFTETFTHSASVSIGIAMFPGHGENVPELMANADMAMYHSKRKQPGSWHVFSIDEHAREKLNQRLIVKDLVMDALENDLFELQYQPIINVKTGQLKYYEALIRIRKKDGQLIYPDSFIPVAEQTGMIRKVDQWVIEQSMRVLLKQPEIALSINLSSYALADEIIVETISSIIKQSGINPSRLLLEVTESGVIHNLATAINIMQKIRTIGCKFALDDFGTGFASYNHLKVLPVDIIKIDGCFIKNIENSPEDKIFVKSIAEIGGSLNMQVVAEYVENEAILEILSETGVQYAQGYHIGRPADLETFSNLL